MWARLAFPASAPRLFNARGKRARDLPIPTDKLMELTSHRTRRGPGPEFLVRYAEATEIADAVAFLASPRSKFINGQVLRVDGGETPFPG